MYSQRRLMSSVERNRGDTVAACSGENRACCPVARTTPPSEIDSDTKGHIDRPVGEEEDRDQRQDPNLTCTGARRVRKRPPGLGISWLGGGLQVVVLTAYSCVQHRTDEQLGVGVAGVV